jgi:hypothetical protein
VLHPNRNGFADIIVLEQAIVSTKHSLTLSIDGIIHVLPVILDPLPIARGNPRDGRGMNATC